MAISTYRSTLIWEQISLIVDEFIQETGLDLDAKGDISVQMRKDTPNAKIKAVLSTEIIVDVDDKKTGQNLYEILFPLVSKALKRASDKHDSVTEFRLTLDRVGGQKIVNISVKYTRSWLVNLKTGLTLACKRTRQNSDPLLLAEEQLRRQIPLFLNTPHQMLSIFIKNGSFSGVKKVRNVEVPDLPKSKDAFYEAFLNTLFSGATREQHEFVGSFSDGKLFVSREIKHKDFGNC